MRFLRQSRGRSLLSTCLIALSFNTLWIYAADRSNDAPIEADDVDLAKLQSGGHVAFVSSGQRPAGFHSIDDDRRTVFPFASSDARPTVIVKLTDSRPIHRVSVVPGSASSKVDVYLFDELPRNPSELDKSTPLTSIVELVVGKESAVEFPPQRARYVALRWTPALIIAEGFKVAEISAFTKRDSPHAADAPAVTDPPVFLVQGLPVVAPVSP